MIYIQKYLKNIYVNGNISIIYHNRCSVIIKVGKYNFLCSNIRRIYMVVKKCVAVIASAAVLSLVVPAFGQAESTPKVEVNGTIVETDARLIDDRIYVPLRAVSEMLGAEVNWNSDTNTASVTLNHFDNVIPSILKKVSPCVVGIIGNWKTKNGDSYSSRYQEEIIHGTGVIIEQDGKILTNAHVVSEMETIVVVLSDGSGYQANLLSIDEESDLALIKIDRTGLPVAELANEEDVVIGQYVVAIGTPISFSLRNSASIGIISGVNRSINSSYRLIQTDAAINPGNSGGPLINLDGKVVGINSSKFMGTGIEGMGFSIPLNTINYVLDHFKKYGRVMRPYLGTEFQEGWAARIGLPSDEGLEIISVKENSAADQAGLKEGDILISINDCKVHSIVDFNEEMKKYVPNNNVNIKFERDGVIQNISVVLTSK